MVVVFLRGVDVGGHRRFRPSLVARELRRYDVVNVGATGTFIVRKPGSRAKFLAALRRKLPFKAEIMLCHARDLIALETENPFESEKPATDVVRCVSILSRRVRRAVPKCPFVIPQDGDWFVRVIAIREPFVFGVYRRHMKTIGYLGKIDEAFGVPVTTRSWGTILSILRILKKRL